MHCHTNIKPTCVLQHCREEKPTVGSPFSGEFPSDRMPKAKKDIKVRLFIHSSNSCKLYQGTLGNFWSYYVLPW